MPEKELKFSEAEIDPKEALYILNSPCSMSSNTWFDNFPQSLGKIGKEKAPEKGTKEYLAMFRKWVPYETDEKGEAKLDEKGYPIPRKTAPMTVAAEDELARVEAAMEETDGQER